MADSGPQTVANHLAVHRGDQDIVLTFYRTDRRKQSDDVVAQVTVSKESMPSIVAALANLSESETADLPPDVDEQINKLMPSMAELDEMATPPVQAWLDDRGWKDYDRQ